MTMTRTIILTAAAALLTSPGALSAADAPQHQKGQLHRHHRQLAGKVSGQHRGAVQYGNNTRDNSYGGVYGEYAPQPQ